MGLLGEILVEYALRVPTVNPQTGRTAYAAPTWLPWRATLNPIPGEVLATLEEGERMGKQLRALSDDVALPANDDYTQTVGALVRYDGQVYEVRDRQPYPTVIPHYEYRLRRLLPGQR